MEGALPRSAPTAPRLGPELTFAVEDAGALEHAAVPTLRFALRVECAGSARIRSLALNVQLRIAATRRRYSARAEERLLELFGHPEQWARSLRSLHWVNVPLQVGPFEGRTVVDLAVPCTYDLEVTATRYFQALEDGEVPLEFLFAGTVFYAGEDGGLQVAPIAWDREAEFRLPVAVWRETMDRHFPGSAWLRLGRASFERLHAYRARQALLTWDDAVDRLLRAAGEEAAAKDVQEAPNGSAP
jgi:uncharacterized protein DUF6084